MPWPLILGSSSATSSPLMVILSPSINTFTRSSVSSPVSFLSPVLFFKPFPSLVSTLTVTSFSALSSLLSEALLFFLVVITTTPFSPFLPYKAVAEAPFKTSIFSISLGEISLTFFISLPSTMYNGVSPFMAMLVSFALPFTTTTVGFLASSFNFKFCFSLVCAKLICVIKHNIKKLLTCLIIFLCLSIDIFLKQM